MLYLKEANFEDAEQEWQFIAATPAEENGVTNRWHGVSRERFLAEALPEMINHAKGVGLPEGFVPATTFFLWNDTEIVGLFRLRHYLPESLIPGHIGYFIAKEHRGKGFATEGLRLTLAYGADIIPEDEFYLRLNRDNPASLRVMLKNGGRIVGETADKLIVKIPKNRNNIFDNERFFAGYQALRRREQNSNDLIIDPAMDALLPDLTDKTVLDLGCGDGKHCADFLARGAKRVVGIDISEKMLRLAETQNADAAIRYLRMSMTDIAELMETFDFIDSNMAFHYIEDFPSFAKTLYAALEPGGALLFAQEHPVVTATADGGGHFNKSPSGRKLSYTFSDYGAPGERVTHWFVDGVVKYHRRVSDIINALTGAGFVIERVEEPLPEEWVIEKYPAFEDERIKPTFLIVKARKGKRDG